MCFLLALFALLGASCFIVRKTQTAVQTLTILYAQDLDWTQLPSLASLVKSEKPALTVVCGDLIKGDAASYLFQGRNAAEAIGKAGVNAVCLTPGWLRLGLPAMRYIIDSAARSVFFLSANVNDTFKAGALGQPYLRITLPGPGGAIKLALVGVTADTGNLYLKQDGITYQDPTDAALRAVALLRMNNDVVGILGPANASAVLPGADFSIPAQAGQKPGAVWRLQLQLDAQNHVIGRRTTEIGLADAKPDSVVLSIVRGWQAQAESALNAVINQATVDLDTTALARIAARFAPQATHCDGSLFGNRLKLKPMSQGEITLARLYDISGPDNNTLVRLRLEGYQIEQLNRTANLDIEWRGILQRQRLTVHRAYSLVTTVDYVRSRPDLAAKKLDFLPVSLAQVFATAFRNNTAAPPDTE
jgi:hypothetical protein